MPAAVPAAVLSLLQLLHARGLLPAPALQAGSELLSGPGQGAAAALLPALLSLSGTTAALAAPLHAAPALLGLAAPDCLAAGSSSSEDAHSGPSTHASAPRHTGAAPAGPVPPPGVAPSPLPHAATHVASGGSSSGAAAHSLSPAGGPPLAAASAGEQAAAGAAPSSAFSRVRPSPVLPSPPGEEGLRSGRGKRRRRAAAPEPAQTSSVVSADASSHFDATGHEPRSDSSSCGVEASVNVSPAAGLADELPPAIAAQLHAAEHASALQAACTYYAYPADWWSAGLLAATAGAAIRLQTAVVLEWRATAAARRAAQARSVAAAHTASWVAAAAAGAAAAGGSAAGAVGGGRRDAGGSAAGSLSQPPDSGSTSRASAASGSLDSASVGTSGFGSSQGSTSTASGSSAPATASARAQHASLPLPLPSSLSARDRIATVSSAAAARLVQQPWGRGGGAGGPDAEANALAQAIAARVAARRAQASAAASQAQQSGAGAKALPASSAEGSIFAAAPPQLALGASGTRTLTEAAADVATHGEGGGKRRRVGAVDALSGAGGQGVPAGNGASDGMGPPPAKRGRRAVASTAHGGTKADESSTDTPGDHLGSVSSSSSSAAPSGASAASATAAAPLPDVDAEGDADELLAMAQSILSSMGQQQQHSGQDAGLASQPTSAARPASTSLSPHPQYAGRRSSSVGESPAGSQGRSHTGDAGSVLRGVGSLADAEAFAAAAQSGWWWNAADALAGSGSPEGADEEEGDAAGAAADAAAGDAGAMQIAPPPRVGRQNLSALFTDAAAASEDEGSDSRHPIAAGVRRPTGLRRWASRQSAASRTSPGAVGGAAATDAAAGPLASDAGQGTRWAAVLSALGPPPPSACIPPPAMPRLPGWWPGAGLSLAAAAASAQGADAAGSGDGSSAAAAAALSGTIDSSRGVLRARYVSLAGGRALHHMEPLERRTREFDPLGALAGSGPDAAGASAPEASQRSTQAEGASGGAGDESTLAGLAAGLRKSKGGALRPATAGPRGEAQSSAEGADQAAVGSQALALRQPVPRPLPPPPPMPSAVTRLRPADWDAVAEWTRRVVMWQQALLAAYASALLWQDLDPQDTPRLQWLQGAPRAAATAARRLETGPCFAAAAQGASWGPGSFLLRFAPDDAAGNVLLIGTRRWLLQGLAGVESPGSSCDVTSAREGQPGAATACTAMDVEGEGAGAAAHPRGGQRGRRRSAAAAATQGGPANRPGRGRGGGAAAAAAAASAAGRGRRATRGREAAFDGAGKEGEAGAAECGASDGTDGSEAEDDADFTDGPAATPAAPADAAAAAPHGQQAASAALGGSRTPAPRPLPDVFCVMFRSSRALRQRLRDRGLPFSSPLDPGLALHDAGPAAAAGAAEELTALLADPAALEALKRAGVTVDTVQRLRALQAAQRARAQAVAAALQEGGAAAAEASEGGAAGAAAAASTSQTGDSGQGQVRKGAGSSRGDRLRGTPASSSSTLLFSGRRAVGALLQCLLEAVSPTIPIPSSAAARAAGKARAPTSTVPAPAGSAPTLAPVPSGATSSAASTAGAAPVSVPLSLLATPQAGAAGSLGRLSGGGGGGASDRFIDVPQILSLAPFTHGSLRRLMLTTRRVGLVGGGEGAVAGGGVGVGARGGGAVGTGAGAAAAAAPSPWASPSTALDIELLGGPVLPGVPERVAAVLQRALATSPYPPTSNQCGGARKDGLSACTFDGGAARQMHGQDALAEQRQIAALDAPEQTAAITTASSQELGLRGWMLPEPHAATLCFSGAPGGALQSLPPDAAVPLGRLQAARALVAPPVPAAVGAASSALSASAALVPAEVLRLLLT